MGERNTNLWSLFFHGRLNVPTLSLKREFCMARFYCINRDLSRLANISVGTEMKMSLLSLTEDAFSFFSVLVGYDRLEADDQIDVSS